MRVVAGTARGRRLRAPKGRAVRPTTDRVKEAVFSMLESRDGCDGRTILDLFAGSGALGIEALSRGAAEAVFVESSREAAQALRENLDRAQLRGTVMQTSVARALRRLAAAGRRFDGVFLDPPYERGWIRRTLASLAATGLVRAGGWIVVEHGRHEVPPERTGALVCRVQRCYGDTWIALFSGERRAENVHGHE